MSLKPRHGGQLTDFPTDLKSVFLQNACSAFAGRSKALRYHARSLECTRDTWDQVERVTIIYTPLGNEPIVTLQLSAENHATLFVSSNWNVDRGKTLCQIEGVLLVDNGSALVELFEKTVAQTYGATAESGQTWSRVTQQWEELGLREVE